jgi:hypothetical protein
MACGFLIGALSFSPLLSTHIGGVRTTLLAEARKQQSEVYIVVAYINHIYSRIHISWYSVVDSTYVTCRLHTACLPDRNQQRLSVLYVYLAGLVPSF